MADKIFSVGRRTISNGNEFNSLFPEPLLSDPIVNSDGDLDFTLLKMAQYAEKGRSQVSKIASKLKGSDTLESCRNIHGFIMKYIQYNQDKRGIEQLRSPSRTWHDRASGVDCDCMSIFASAILREMGINHRFRIVKFGGADFEHVYVVVPRKGSSISSGQIILDGVIHQFDVEKQYSQAQDYAMNGTKLQLLSGIPVQYLNGLSGIGPRIYSDVQISDLSRKLKQYLIAQREAIQKNTQQVKFVNPVQAVTNINFALSVWDNPSLRKDAIDQLAEKEQQYNPETYFFRTIRSFLAGVVDCSQVCKSGYIQLSQSEINLIQSGLSGLSGSDYLDMHSAEHGLNKTLMAPARAAFLMLMQLNTLGWAEKMAPAFFPVNKAGESGESSWFYGHGNLEGKLGTVKDIDYNKQFTNIFGLAESQHLLERKQMYDYILRRWWNLGGDWVDFKVSILKGAHNLLVRARPLPGYQYWCKYNDYYIHSEGSVGPRDITPTWKEIDGLSGISALGDPAAAAVIAAAAAVITALTPLVAQFKNPGNATGSGPVVLPSNPTTNPDPSGHPLAVLSPTTGLWTDPTTGAYYNPATSQWEGGSDTASNFKKYGLLLLAALGIGYGVYSIIPDEKTKKIAHAK